MPRKKKENITNIESENSNIKEKKNINVDKIEKKEKNSNTQETKSKKKNKINEDEYADEREINNNFEELKLKYIEISDEILELQDKINKKDIDRNNLLIKLRKLQNYSIFDNNSNDLIKSNSEISISNIVIKKPTLNLGKETDDDESDIDILKSNDELDYSDSNDDSDSDNNDKKN